MQSSSTQQSKTQSDFYISLQSNQIPGAFGEPQPMLHLPRWVPGSAGRNSVAPAPEGTSVYPQKLPWTTISLPVPRDHFTLVIFAAMCCLPLGLVAVYRSTQCKDAIKRDDLNTARVRSRQAKTLSYWSMGFGALCLVAATIGLSVYFASVYDMRFWPSRRVTQAVRLDPSQDDRPPPTSCCMQA